MSGSLFCASSAKQCTNQHVVHGTNVALARSKSSESVQCAMLGRLSLSWPDNYRIATTDMDIRASTVTVRCTDEARSRRWRVVQCARVVTARQQALEYDGCNLLCHRTCQSAYLCRMCWFIDAFGEFLEIRLVIVDNIQVIFTVRLDVLLCWHSNLICFCLCRCQPTGMLFVLVLTFPSPARLARPTWRARYGGCDDARRWWRWRRADQRPAGGRATGRVGWTARLFSRRKYR